MPWVRKDDQMPIHRKVAPLSDAAYRLLDEATCWSARNLTDGVVRADELDSISKRGLPKLAAELVGRRLWHEAGHQCESDTCPPAGTDGWVIHDFWDYQPSRQQVEGERRAKADRMRNWREAKKKRNGASGTPRSTATEAPRDTSRDGLQGGPRDGSRDGLVAPTPYPVPDPAPPRRAGGDYVPAATADRRQAADAAAGGRSEDPTPVVRRHQLEPSPDEDPQALADEADDIRRTAEALVAEAHQQQNRNAHGAAAARAAITKPATKPSRHGGGLDALRAATPDVPVLADDPEPPSTDVTSDPDPKPEDHPKEPQPDARSAA